MILSLSDIRRYEKRYTIPEKRLSNIQEHGLPQNLCYRLQIILTCLQADPKIWGMLGNYFKEARGGLDCRERCSAQDFISHPNAHLSTICSRAALVGCWSATRSTRKSVSAQCGKTMIDPFLPRIKRLVLSRTLTPSSEDELLDKSSEECLRYRQPCDYSGAICFYLALSLALRLLLSQGGLTLRKMLLSSYWAEASQVSSLLAHYTRGAMTTSSSWMRATSLGVGCKTRPSASPGGHSRSNKARIGYKAHRPVTVLRTRFLCSRRSTASRRSSMICSAVYVSLYAPL